MRRYLSSAFVRASLPALLVALLAGVAAAAALLVRNGAATTLHEFPLDDAWIHQVYARGLLRDGLPTYNPGEVETGFSSPLWMLVLAPVQLLAVHLGASLVLLTKGVGLLFALAVAVAIAALVRRLGGSPIAVALAPAFALLSPTLGFAALSGMEVPLAAALVGIGWLCLDGRSRWRAGFAFALAALARPEALVVPLTIAAIELVESPRARVAEALRRAAATCAPSLVAVSTWAAFDLWATGHPLPNTYYVKHAAGLFDVVEGARYLLGSVVFADPLLAAPAAIAIAVGIASVRGQAARWRFGRIVLVTTTTALVAIVATRALPPRAGYTAQRYFHPFTIYAVPWIVVGLDRVAMAIRDAARVRAWLAWVALGALFALAAAPPLSRARVAYAAHCARIDRLHTEPARMLARDTPEGALVGVEAAGAARFHGDRRILDLVGLNAHALAHASSAEALHCEVVRRHPAYFLVPAEWLSLLGVDFELRALAAYRSARWSDRAADRVVAFASARVRPEAEEACRRLEGSR